MARKRTVVTLTVIAAVAIAVSTIGFSLQLQGVKGKPIKPSIQTDEARAQGRGPRQFPDHVTYEFLFRKIQFLVDKNIPDSRFYTMMQEEYGLNAAQAEKLKQIALSSVTEVKLQDIRAQEIIAQVRASCPNGKLAPGQKPPTVPPELVAAQEARNAMILRERSELHAFLGNDSFNRFDQSVKKKIRVPSSPNTSAQ